MKTVLGKFYSDNRHLEMPIAEFVEMGFMK